MLELSEIYQPVKKDLKTVEEQFSLLAESKCDSFPELYQMLKHTLVGGKVIRPALTLLSCRCFNYNRTKILPMATASELLHIATLVHDDAIDKADTRRGRPTVNNLWGTDKAVLLGDYLFARAGEFAAATENIPVVKLFSRTLQIISSGELNQAFDAFSSNQSFEQYKQRIAAKTAALIVMSTESGAILGGASKEEMQFMNDYGLNLGIAFQIVDDILDFIGDEKEMGKPVGSDLAQGTVTLPALMLIERHPDDNPIDKIFNHQDKEKNVRLAVEMVRNSSIIDDSYRIAGEYISRACSCLQHLPESTSRRSLLSLARYIIKRQH
jgi:geranylgeranyl pyrophosphate synthase